MKKNFHIFFKINNASLIYNINKNYCITSFVCPPCHHVFASWSSLRPTTVFVAFIVLMPLTMLHLESILIYKLPNKTTSSTCTKTQTVPQWQQKEWWWWWHHHRPFDHEACNSGIHHGPGGLPPLWNLISGLTALIANTSIFNIHTHLDDKANNWKYLQWTRSDTLASFSSTTMLFSALALSTIQLIK